MLHLNTSAPATSVGVNRHGASRLEKRGIKRTIMGPQVIRPFYLGNVAGGSSILPTVVGTRGVNEDGINDSNKRRKVKKIVTTIVGGIIDHEVRNINSTVEEYAPNAYGDENEVCGDDEGSDGSDDSHAEAPNDEDIVVRTQLKTTRSHKNPRRRSARLKNN